MKNIIILLLIITSFNSSAEIIRNKNTITGKEIQDAQEDIKQSSHVLSAFADDGSERLRIFKDQGSKEMNNGGNSQFIDIRIPLIWYVHVF